MTETPREIFQNLADARDYDANVLSFAAAAEAVLSQRFSVDKDTYAGHLITFSLMVELGLADVGITIGEVATIDSSFVQTVAHAISVIGIQEMYSESVEVNKNLIRRSEASRVLLALSDYARPGNPGPQPDGFPIFSEEDMQRMRTQIQDENPEFMQAIHMVAADNSRPETIAIASYYLYRYFEHQDEAEVGARLIRPRPRLPHRGAQAPIPVEEPAEH